MPVFTGGPNPEHTWMAFVDGENFTIRGQEVAEANGKKLVEGKYFQRDRFLWIPQRNARASIFGGTTRLRTYSLRSSYYTGIVGNDEVLGSVRERLRELGFSPEVFKKAKNQRSKGVDIALTKDMLSHAFRSNYEVAVLIAGDGDYVPLVEEVKRLGKSVHVWFFGRLGLSPELRLASDEFEDLTHIFLREWEKVSTLPPA